MSVELTFMKGVVSEFSAEEKLLFDSALSDLNLLLEKHGDAGTLAMAYKAVEIGDNS